ARGPAPLPAHDRDREPGDGRVPTHRPLRDPRRHGSSLRALPALARAPQPEGRDDVGRRAADVRDRSCIDGAPEAAAARRAVARAPFRWLKDKPPDAPAWIRTTPQPAKSRGGALVQYVVVDDAAALLWLVDYGCVDLHVWTARVDRPDRPDIALLDLDPKDACFGR